MSYYLKEMFLFYTLNHSDCTSVCWDTEMVDSFTSTRNWTSPTTPTPCTRVVSPEETGVLGCEQGSSQDLGDRKRLKLVRELAQAWVRVRVRLG